MTEPRSSDPRWSIEAEIAAVRSLVPYVGAPFMAGDEDRAAESILTALADLGVLVAPGGEVREDWRVSSAGESWERVYPTEADADQHLDWAAKLWPDKRPAMGKTRRIVLTGPWLPTARLAEEENPSA